MQRISCDRMSSTNVFNLVDSLDHIYDKMPKLLGSMSDIVYKKM